jgi:hypothetical protein
MFARGSKSRIVAWLLVGITVCVLGCIGMTKLIDKAGESSSQAPVRRLRVILDESQREVLFDQLQKFADKHGFSFVIADYGTGGELYLVEILGDNVKMLATINRTDPKVVSIGFYGRSPEDPPPDEEVVDALVIDLINFISEIPNVTITQEN